MAAALLLSLALNIGASLIFLKMYKHISAKSVLNNDIIYTKMEEFIGNMEKENEELFQNITNYIKVKESEFDEKFRSFEVEKEVLEIVQLESDLTPAKMEDGVEHEKVETLYKQGFSSLQIAKVLKIELGEVELIINMLKKKKSYQQ